MEQLRQPITTKPPRAGREAYARPSLSSSALGRALGSSSSKLRSSGAMRQRRSTAQGSYGLGLRPLITCQATVDGQEVCTMRRAQKGTTGKIRAKGVHGVLAVCTCTCQTMTPKE